MPARGRKRKQSSDEESSESSFIDDDSEEEEELDEESEEEEDDEDERPKRRKAAASKAKKKPTPKRKPAARKQAAKKAPPKKRGRKAKAVSSEEEEEEEEEVLEEEEEEELDAGPDENDPGFDQTLFKDEADRVYLFSLDERERELVLAERFDKWQRYEEWKRLRAERTNRGSTRKSRTAAQPSKRAGGVQIESDDEEDVQKPAPKGSAAALEDNKPVVQKEESSSEEDEDEVSEGESPEDLVESKKPKHDDDNDIDLDEDLDDEKLPQADLPSVSRIVVTRSQILDWTGYPSKRFKQGLPGCLVKVLDTSSQTGNAERYELRMVTKLLLEGNQEYEVDREIVSIYFKVQGGPKNNTKRVPLSRISNKPLTPEEFAVYSKEPLLMAIGRRGVRYISEYLKQKLTGYVLTKEEALAMVEARKVRRGRASALKNTAGLTLVGRKAALNQEIAACNRDRARLSKELEKLDSLEQMDDEDEDDFEERKEEHQKRIFRDLREANERVSKLEQELARVETRIAQDAQRSITNETSIKLNELNEQLNRETIEKVEQLRLAQHASNQGQNLNPFLRRPTRPLMMWDTGSGTAATTESNAAAPAKATTTTTTSTTTSSAEPGLSSTAAVVPVEVVDTVDVQPQQVKLKIQADAPIITSAATKKFSLADYKMMKQQQQRL